MLRLRGGEAAYRSARSEWAEGGAAAAAAAAAEAEGGAPGGGALGLLEELVDVLLFAVGPALVCRPGAGSARSGWAGGHAIPPAKAHTHTRTVAERLRVLVAGRVVDRGHVVRHVRQLRQVQELDCGGGGQAGRGVSGRRGGGDLGGGDEGRRHDLQWQ